MREPLKNKEELLDFIRRVGVLPLFGDTVPGFSAEALTRGSDWFTGDPTRDPWEWRELLAREGSVVYGKLLNNKSAYVAPDWYPTFCNYRRNGYDFDARFEDGLASRREKRIMDTFEAYPEQMTCDLRARAGFGKGGEKGFEGVLAGLQMKGYLIVRRMDRKRNRAGAPYGWPVSVLSRPETMLGEDFMRTAYAEPPEQSLERLLEHLRATNPEADPALFARLLR